MSKALTIIAVIVAVVVGNIMAMNFGPVGSVIAVVVMLLLWWWSYVLKERMMDRCWNEIKALPHEKRVEAIARGDEHFQEAMAKRRAKEELHTGVKQFRQ